MALTTTGIKLDDTTRTGMRKAAEQLERTPHWFMKMAISRLLEKVESGARLTDLLDSEALLIDQERYSTGPRLNLRAFARP